MEILNRVNEISFNSSLIREMRAIRFVTQLIDDGYVVNGSLRRMRIHAVADDDVFTKLNVASKLDANWEFLTSLRDTGRARAMAELPFRPHRRRIHRGSPSRLHVTAVKAAHDRSFRPRPGVCGVATTRTFSQPF
jgi:NTE family protein